MKHPTAPRHPYKPSIYTQQPAKTIPKNASIELMDGMLLQELIDQAKDAGVDPINVRLSLGDQDSGYFYYVAGEIPNPHYDYWLEKYNKDKEKYEAALIKYEKDLAAYKVKQAKYEADMIKYKKWFYASELKKLNGEET